MRINEPDRFMIRLPIIDIPATRLAEIIRNHHKPGLKLTIRTQDHVFETDEDLASFPHLLTNEMVVDFNSDDIRSTVMSIHRKGISIAFSKNHKIQAESLQKVLLDFKKPYLAMTALPGAIILGFVISLISAAVGTYLSMDILRSLSRTGYESYVGLLFVLLSFTGWYLFCENYSVLRVRSDNSRDWWSYGAISLVSLVIAPLLVVFIGHLLGWNG